MIKAFTISFRLRIHYSVNAKLRVLRDISFLKKILPGDIYSKSFIKNLVLVYAVLSELFTFLLGKLGYIVIMIAMPVFALIKEAGVALPLSEMAVNIFFFLSFIGIILKNPIFDPSDEMYYAVFLMRMDAKKYAISNYIYFLIKTFSGFLILFALCNLLIPGLSIPVALIFLLPLFDVGIKLCASVLQIFFFRKKGELFSGDKQSRGIIIIGLILVFLAAAYVPLFAFGKAISAPVVIAFCSAFIVLGVLSFLFLLHADDYRRILKYVVMKSGPGAIDDVQKKVSQETKNNYLKKLSYEDDLPDAVFSSNKRGVAYFNEIFVNRHKKMLMKSSLRIAAVSAVVFIAAVCLFYFNKELGEQVNGRFMGILPIFLFVMYLINRGQSVTQILFFNCDSSMMNYNFYRRPDVILALFTERLKSILKINLLPAGVIALGLPLVYRATGGTDRPVEYLIIVVSIISMSVFFSVHYLAMYYLLQPYTEGLVQKGVAYRVVMFFTYFFCYMCVQIKELRDNSLVFGAVVSSFAVLYIVVALILTYRLAPKNFRLRK